MKIRSWFVGANLALWVWVAQPALADDFVRYTASPVGSSVKVDGDSTLHRWTMESKIIGGSLEIDPKVHLDSAKATVAGLDGNLVPMKATVSIPVRALKSHATAMDNVCQDAMDTKKFPKIEYRLAELAVTHGEHKPGTPFQFISVGNLVVHGVTNKLNMLLTIESVEADKLMIKGSTPLKMTSFGVKPPAPALAGGAIKTADDIKVSFEWLVKKAEPAK